MDFQIRIVAIEVLTHIVVKFDFLLEYGLRKDCSGECFGNRRNRVQSVGGRRFLFSFFDSAEVVRVCFSVLEYPNGQSDRLRSALEKVFCAPGNDCGDILGWLRLGV